MPYNRARKAAKIREEIKRGLDKPITPESLDRLFRLVRLYDQLMPGAWEYAEKVLAQPSN